MVYHIYMERWLSGRKRLTRNQVCGKPYRGFESHPLRKYNTLPKGRVLYLRLDEGFERGREKPGGFSCGGKVLENQKVFQRCSNRSLQRPPTLFYFYFVKMYTVSIASL